MEVRVLLPQPLGPATAQHDRLAGTENFRGVRPPRHRRNRTCRATQFERLDAARRRSSFFGLRMITRSEPRAESLDHAAPLDRGRAHSTVTYPYHEPKDLFRVVGRWHRCNRPSSTWPTRPCLKLSRGN